MNINVNSIKAVAKLKGSRGLLKARKYSPEILTGVGILGGITSAVMASKATLKLEPIVDGLTEHVEIAGARHVAGDFDDRAHKRNLAFLYTRATIDIGKLYAPAVSVGIASISCIIGAQGIMQKRNVALVAAYSAVEKGFSEYRKRVEDVVGSDKEAELYYNATPEVVKTKNAETGSTESKTLLHIDPNNLSGYAKFFDELNDNWSEEPEYNRMFIRTQQNYANDKLQVVGHVFLNEVYDSLGIPRTPQGQIVGWTLSTEGDNFIDFGVYSGTESSINFVNGRSPGILLDFNVDGVIFDKL